MYMSGPGVEAESRAYRQGRQASSAFRELYILGGEVSLSGLSASQLLLHNLLLPRVLSQGAMCGSEGSVRAAELDMELIATFLCDLILSLGRYSLSSQYEFPYVNTAGVLRSTS